MRIGVSGHQNLGPANVIEWVRQEIKAYLQKQAFVAGISSLAAGADQLFARSVVELGRDLEVVIPCDRYETTFVSAPAINEYRQLLDCARKTHTLSFDHPCEEAFYNAGRLVVDVSDSMILVWNGKPARGLGGTADIAKYAKAMRRPSFWINPTAATTSIVSCAQ